MQNPTSSSDNRPHGGDSTPPSSNPPSPPYSNSSTPPHTHPRGEPDLEIPAVLRTPVRRPDVPGVPGKANGKQGGVGGLVSNLGAGYGLAMDFLGLIGGGAFLGWLVDRWRHSLPIGVLVGLGVGFLAAMIRIVRQSQKSERLDRAARGNPRKDQPGVKR